MLEILDLVNECSSKELSSILTITKRVLNIIQIIGPILLIIAIVMHLIKLMSNPDDKKLVPKIRNSIIAAIVIFFIPMMINVIMGMLDDSFSITACWNSAEEYNSNSQYIDIDGNEKKSILSDGYEKGDKTQTSTGIKGDSTGDYTGLDGTATQIGDVVWDPNDVTKISNLTTAQLIKILSTTKKYKKAVNFIPYASALITAEQKYHVNVFFLLGIQAVESGWVTSAISKNCNNLGGVRESKAHPSNGCGRNKGGGFAYFNTVNEFIDYQASLLHNHYLTQGGKYYYGTTPEAVATKYCSGSKSWSTQVRNIAGTFFNQVSNIM